jgi:Tol biopolymer transport system component
VQSDRQTNLWLAPEGDARQARQLTFGKGSDGEGLSWTPDNRIVYVSQVSGNQEIWIMSAAGGDQKQLTNDPQADILPAVSDDGRYIVFLSSRSGTIRLWRMNMDGSQPRQLSKLDARVIQPLISSDSRMVTFRDDNNKNWIVPIEGGEPEPAKPSDVEKRRAGWGYTEKGIDGIARRNLTVRQGGEPQRFDIPQTIATTINPRFRSDGSAVYYVDAPTGVSNIWSFPLDGGQPKQVTNFQSEQIFAFAYSPDGKQIAVTRGSQTNDVVLLRDFR